MLLSEHNTQDYREVFYGTWPPSNQEGGPLDAGVVMPPLFFDQLYTLMVDYIHSVFGQTCKYKHLWDSQSYRLDRPYECLLWLLVIGLSWWTFGGTLPLGAAESLRHSLCSSCFLRWARLSLPVSVCIPICLPVCLTVNYFYQISLSFYLPICLPLSLSVFVRLSSVCLPA